MNKKQLTQFFNDAGFNVYHHIQNNVECTEIERWTDGGVDMIIWLNPFTKEEFISYVNDFDVDEQITLHRQDELYCQAFTIRRSLEDFEKFHSYLKELITKLT